MSDVWSSLDRTRLMIWHLLQKGASDKRAAAHQVALATEAKKGGGEVRLVILRGADPDAGVLTFHTDKASAKIEEISREPRASVLVWDKRIRLQIRCRIRVSTRDGLLGEWAAMKDRQKRQYGGNVPPGTPLKSPEDFVPTSDPSRFAVLLATIDELESLHLGRDRHRRALFKREDEFAGQWIAP